MYAWRHVYRQLPRKAIFIAHAHNGFRKFVVRQEDEIDTQSCYLLHTVLLPSKALKTDPLSCSWCSSPLQIQVQAGHCQTLWRLAIMILCGGDTSPSLGTRRKEWWADSCGKPVVMRVCVPRKYLVNLVTWLHISVASPHMVLFTYLHVCVCV